MKKVFVCVLVLMMVSAGSLIAFAAEGNQDMLSDVREIRYEDPSESLMSRESRQGIEENESDIINEKDVIEIKVGVITRIIKTVNADWVQVYEIELGSDRARYTFETDVDCKVPYPYVSKGEVYCLKLVNGLVTDISAEGEFINHFKELTNKWECVTDKKGRNVIILAGTNEKNINISRGASVYEAEFWEGEIDDYDDISISNIKEGCLIRAYDITDDSIESADIIIVISPEDASNM